MNDDYRSQHNKKVPKFVYLEVEPKEQDKTKNLLLELHGI